MLLDPPIIPSRPMKSSRLTPDPESSLIPVVPQRPNPVLNSIDPVLPPRPIRTTTRPDNVPGAPPSVPRRPTRSEIIVLDSTPLDRIASAGEGYEAGDEAKYSQSETDDASFAPSYPSATWSAAPPAGQYADIINIKNPTDDNVGLDGAVTSHHGGYESGDEARPEFSQIAGATSVKVNEINKQHETGLKPNSPKIRTEDDDGALDPSMLGFNNTEHTMESRIDPSADEDPSFPSRDDGACTPQTTETRLTFKNDSGSFTDPESGFDDDDETIMPDAHDCHDENLDFGDVNADQSQASAHEEPFTVLSFQDSTTDQTVEPASSSGIAAGQSGVETAESFSKFAHDQGLQIQPNTATLGPSSKSEDVSTANRDKLTENAPKANENLVKSNSSTSDSGIDPESSPVLPASERENLPSIPARPKKSATNSSLNEAEHAEKANTEERTHAPKLSETMPADANYQCSPVPDNTDSFLGVSEDAERSAGISNADEAKRDVIGNSSSTGEHEKIIEDTPASPSVVPIRPAEKDTSSGTSTVASTLEPKAPPPKPKKLSAKMSAFQQMFEKSQKPSTENKPPVPSKRPQGQTRLSDDKMRFAQSLKGVMGRGIPMPGMVSIDNLAEDPAILLKNEGTMRQTETETAAAPSAPISKLRIKGPRGRKLPSTFKEPVALEPTPTRFTIASHRLFEIGSKSDDKHILTLMKDESCVSQDLQPDTKKFMDTMQAVFPKHGDEKSSTASKGEENAIQREKDADTSTDSSNDFVIAKKDDSCDENRRADSAEQEPETNDLDSHDIRPENTTQTLSQTHPAPVGETVLALSRAHSSLISATAQVLDAMEDNTSSDSEKAIPSGNLVDSSKEAAADGEKNTGVIDEHQDDAAILVSDKDPATPDVVKDQISHEDTEF